MNSKKNSLPDNLFALDFTLKFWPLGLELSHGDCQLWLKERERVHNFFGISRHPRTCEEEFERGHFFHCLFLYFYFSSTVGLSLNTFSSIVRYLGLGYKEKNIVFDFCPLSFVKSVCVCDFQKTRMKAILAQLKRTGVEPASGYVYQGVNPPQHSDSSQGRC